MLYCRHSVFCSSRILAVCRKRDIIYHLGQIPDFAQYMVGLYIVGGQHVLICRCSSLWSGRK